MDGTNVGEVPAAARQLRDLALEYADRALRSQADLVRAFEADARPWIRGLGELVVDDDDDERLVLSVDGRFVGSVVDSDTSAWEPVGSAEDVAEHYDPVDLFTDLATAIEEMFPGLIDTEVSDLEGPRSEGLPAVASAPSDPGTPTDRTMPPSPNGAAPDGADPARDEAAPASEQLRVLEDLHEAGAITDSQFEEARANLGR